MNKGEIIIYQTPEGNVSLNVRLENETVWLSQKQIAELFGTKRPAITKHLSNIYKTGELEEFSTCSILEHMGNDEKQQYQTKFYNLDAIISVGYRVNSQNATHFRIWANRILKDYLIKGYAVNEKMKLQQYGDLKQTVKLLSNVLQSKELSADEATGLLQVISDYTYALDTLDRYDYQTLTVEQTTPKESFRATYETAMKAINYLRDKFGGSDLFGNEKDQSFKSSINTIYQTFDGKDLYPSVEEKGAMLLYLVTKNHSFSDGNKRIAAFLFLWFLEKNGILYKTDGTKLIENNTLVALTLMIAESRTEEKDVMVKVVVNLTNKNN
ncbi:prophage maintenance system killer protein [Parabacteroides sp. PFB2-12]|uniref:RhuM family protein n=1 Tax=unclassified Parabacteroides TaxID=2649774 RepID=UPI0024747F4B|nr:MULTISPECIES: RhuM family protein [unclassified Parabacteroides]MDH6344220.1 prophage maintenance system killer protein [Parabacteroides sp. PM6-13]MDH6392164.1 prophage maintenance system killer protein [Parabacteroides sp. PFB2-12]